MYICVSSNLHCRHTQQVFKLQKMWPQGSHTNTYRLLLESIFECQRWSFNFLRPLPQLHKGVGFQRKSFTRRLDLCSFGGPDKLLGSKSSHVFRLVWVTGKNMIIRGVVEIVRMSLQGYHIKKVHILETKVQVFSSWSFVSLVIMGKRGHTITSIKQENTYLRRNKLSLKLMVIGKAIKHNHILK